jgi:hypothetical protein
MNQFAETYIQNNKEMILKIKNMKKKIKKFKKRRKKKKIQNIKQYCYLVREVNKRKARMDRWSNLNKLKLLSPCFTEIMGGGWL